MNRRSVFKLLVAAVVLGLPAIIASSFGNASGAEANGGAHEAGLPTVVILQFINFGLYVGLVIYFGRKPIAAYFKNRQAGFYSALKRADAARNEAQAKRAETQARLTKLETTRDESLQSARREAAVLREQIVNEAKALSERLRVDAARTAEVEVARAKQSLRDELLTRSMQMAERILKDKMQEQDQKRLQDEFVEKIQRSGNQSAPAAVTS